MLDRDRLHVADAGSSLRVEGNAVEREGLLEAERSSSEDAFYHAAVAASEIRRLWPRNLVRADECGAQVVR
jgi:hypothetical protein